MQATDPSFHVGQDNSIWLVTKRAALPGALAVGLLAIGGVITGAFSTPLPGTDRADASGPGGTASVPIFSPPALTAMSTSSPTLPPMADRGVRTPIGASDPPWPIIEQAGTAGVTGNGDTRGTGTTTIVRDRAPDPGAFAPTVTAQPPAGHGGGGGPAESSVQSAPPTAGGGALPDLFGPGSPLNGLSGGTGDSDNTSPSRESSDHPSRIDRRGDDRDTDGRGRSDRGFGSPGKTTDGGSGNRGSDGQTGGGGQHRRGGGRQ